MELYVLYEFSDLYAPYAGVSILSLLENNIDIDTIEIYVLDDGISNINKEKLQQIVEKYRRKIIYIETEQISQMLQDCNVPMYKGSYATYYKLFGLKYLPSKVKQILYLDSDTVIVGKLNELTHCVSYDCPCAMVLDPIYDKYKDILGIGREKNYFNCGMGVFNVDIWTRECEPEILQLLQYKQSGFFIVDQDIINSLYCDRIQKLPLKYNLTGAFVLYTSDEIYKLYGYREHTMYSKKEIEETVKRPVVCHYIAYQAGRPWEKDNIHPMSVYFDEYLKKSPWNDLKKKSSNLPIVTRMQRMCYKYLPRPFYIMIHRFILGKSMGRMAKAAERKVS